MEEFQPKCFDIDIGENEPDDNEPLTGEEYLKRVIWESKRTPNVATANIDYSKINSKPPSKNYFSLPPKIAQCKLELLPNSQWEKDFLYDFSEFRQKLQFNISNYIQFNDYNNNNNNLLNFPHINDKKSWFTFCFGNNENNNKQEDDDDELVNGTTSEEEGDDEIDLDDESIDSMDDDYEVMDDIQSKINKFHIHPNSKNINNNNINNKIANLPGIEIISKFDHLITVALVNYHIEWFENRELTNERSQWLYILLSILEKPIDSNTSASLRSLLRRLALQRSKIESVNDPLLPSINILITIVAKYFNQVDPNEL